MTGRLRIIGMALVLLSACSAAVQAQETAPMMNERQDTLNGRYLRELLLTKAREHLGNRYRYGSRGPGSFDCSGFAKYAYKQIGITLMESSRTQYTQGVHIRQEELQPGDLVFFARPGSSYIHHVGIVVDVNPENHHFTFIHAAYTGVIISSSEEEYYKKRYYGATRMID